MGNFCATIGIDGSRIRSGGAIAHLRGLLSGSDPREFGIGRVHLWCSKELKDRLPRKEWLVFHTPTYLEKNLAFQIYWQKFRLRRELQKFGCDLLFNLDGSTFCQSTPCVTLSQDMLSYEPGILERYPLSLAKLRLIIILYLQNSAFRRSEGVIFLTKYASDVIRLKTGPLKNVAIIPHGVDTQFFVDEKSLSDRNDRDFVKCIYVSNTDIYKNQVAVIEAVRLLRIKGFELKLTLVGGGSGPVQAEVERLLSSRDEEYGFLTQLEFLSSDQLPALIRDSDLYIFASSCENMPVTLLEGMASGIPIACSESGPMPEVIGTAAEFFDPVDPSSIAFAIERLVSSPERAQQLAREALQLSRRYRWESTANRTWQYISDIIGQVK